MTSSSNSSKPSAINTHHNQPTPPRSQRSSSHNITSPIPSIPSVPIINSTPTLQPLQINGVQYLLHPPTATASPVIVVPNINLMNITNNTLPKAPNNKIKQILEKKRNGKDPLTKDETKILEAAVQSARQQFLCWYQQQALRQQLLLNNNILANPIQLQQSVIQQPLLQTQLPPQMNNNIWINNVPNTYPYNTQSNINGMNANRFSTNNNYINTYNNSKWKKYFALPDPQEFDKVFYNESKTEENIVSIGTNAQCDEYKDNICFALALEGLGTFEFGRYHEQKTVDTFTKTETTKQKRESMYKRIGVKDIVDDCCPWLIRDLMRTQSEFKSKTISTQSNDKTRVIMTNLIDGSNDMVSKQQMDRIIRQITYNPVIPHSRIHSDIYDIYCRNNQFIEISHVDVSNANIKVNATDCDTNVTYDVRYNKDMILNELEVTTLEFYNLCIFMQQHFDPSNDVETLSTDHINEDLFYKTLQKLRDNPHHFKIPTLPLSPAPVDRKLFGTKMNKNNDKHNNNVNITNNIINISNLTINPWSSPYCHNTPNVNISIPAYNQLPFMSPMPPPIIYNIPNPYINTQNNVHNAPLMTMPTNYQPQTQSQSQPKQIKIPNPTSWNIGGL